MNSTLKILVVIVLLLGGVFGLTFLYIYTPRDEDPNGPDVVTGEKPLQFFTSTRRWIPREMYDDVGGSLQDTEFAGFFEAGETPNAASFWFANRRPVPVRLQLKQVSCNTCSGGKLAPIPVDVTKQILQMTAISTLPQGLVSGFPLALAVPGAQLDGKRDVLKWQYHPFLTPASVLFELPGAPSGDPWAEQWAIMDLLFKAKPGAEASTLSAIFLTEAQGDEAKFDEKLEIGYFTAPPFELDRTTIEVGELTDASALQKHEVLIYSSTRKPAQLPKLSIAVTMPAGTSGEPGPFVSAGEPVLIPESQYLQLMRTISQVKKRPTRVRCAFLLPITVSARVGDAKLDIGRVERLVHVSLGSESTPIRVAGSMRGPIYLSGAKEISFGIFKYADEQTVSAAVETDRTGLDLRIVPELTLPKTLKVELQKQPDIGDRGVYKLRATLPAKEQLGEITDGVVVLEAKGPNPLRLRIPVTGRGR